MQSDLIVDHFYIYSGTLSIMQCTSCYGFPKDVTWTEHNERLRIPDDPVMCLGTV